MQRLKKYIQIYRISIISIFLIGIIFSLYIRIPDFFSNLILILLLVFIRAIYVSKSKKCFKDFANILDEKCDPEKFIEIQNELLKMYSLKKYKHYKMITKANGLFFAGKYDDAISLLLLIDIKKPKLSIEYSTYYYYILSRVYFEKKEIANFLETKKYIEELILLSNLKISTQKYINIHIKNNNARFLFINNDFENSKKIFEELLNEATAKRLKVINTYMLACIDLKQGSVEEAKTKFNYVVRNGNKLFYVTLAKEELEKLM